MAEPRGWILPAFGIVAGVTALRVLLLAFNRTDLFVDEAQYWFWGQELAFGYYSKPPLIAWVIRAATEIAGSDTPFWVRLPAPLFHAATAMFLGAIAARIYGRAEAIAVAAAFVTLPMVAVGSLLISTDTIMFPFLALALLLYWRLVEEDAGTRSSALPLGAGIALGLAFLAKYAAVYYLGLTAVAAVIWPSVRPRPGDAALILLAFGLTIAPNVAWNVWNGFSTVTHTADNIGWVREGAGLNFAGLAEFLGAQFAVFGPILFGAFALLAVVRARGGARRVPAILLVLSLPIIGLVSAQAVLSKAYANWAAAAYLAGTLAVVPWLMRRPRWLAASYVVNGVICLVLPVAAVFADRLRAGDDLLLKRYLGRAELSDALFAVARESGAAAIVSDDRDILADLFYTGRDAALPVFAWPEDGPPPHHYAQKHPYSGENAGPVLVAGLRDRALPCAGEARPLPAMTGGPGAYQRRTIQLFLVPPDCWKAD
ncbi:ArnT family glycosyltransferase [Ostreiculturibacter nitratireducens]|uniref:ArnT family glycosyltransferase n=1 Tax=Ostreiculturibacter nitratireducens TaxID=3075226 RepID=UPI0031B5A8C4